MVNDVIQLVFWFVVGDFVISEIRTQTFTAFNYNQWTSSQNQQENKQSDNDILTICMLGIISCCQLPVLRSK